MNRRSALIGISETETLITQSKEVPPHVYSTRPAAFPPNPISDSRLGHGHAHWFVFTLLGSSYLLPLRSTFHDIPPLWVGLDAIDVVPIAVERARFIFKVSSSSSTILMPVGQRSESSPARICNPTLGCVFAIN